MNRRELLRWGALSAAGLILPKLVKPAGKVFDLGRNAGLITATYVDCGSCYTIRSGRWDDPRTWLGGRIPRNKCFVAINHQIIIDENSALTNSYVLAQADVFHWAN